MNSPKSPLSWGKRRLLCILTPSTSIDHFMKTPWQSDHKSTIFLEHFFHHNKVKSKSKWLICTLNFAYGFKLHPKLQLVPICTPKLKEVFLSAPSLRLHSIQILTDCIWLITLRPSKLCLLFNLNILCHLLPSTTTTSSIMPPLPPPSAHHHHDSHPFI